MRASSSVGSVRRSAASLPRHHCHLVGGDALALGCPLRRLGGQRALGVGQALSLLEQLLLDASGLGRVVFVDQRRDLAFVLVARRGEHRVHHLRDLELRILARAAPVDVEEVADADARAERADEARVVGLDLGGIAHAPES